MTYRPPRVGDFWIDYSGAHPDPKVTAADGGRGILRYSAGVGNSSPSTAWKLCSPAEIAHATAAGLDFIANSEWYPTRITEGHDAGDEDGHADLSFWRSRGLARGASIYVSWDADPGSRLAHPVVWRRALKYLRAYDAALGGYYHVDCYGGSKWLAYAKRKKAIRYGWRTNAGSWSDDGLPYAPSKDQTAELVKGAAQKATVAHIWQTGNYWFSKNADENVILRTPVGSHLEALHRTDPKEDELSAEEVKEITDAIGEVGKKVDAVLGMFRADNGHLYRQQTFLEHIKDGTFHPFRKLRAKHRAAK